MDTNEEIKERYAKEAETYRKEAWLVNFDAKELFTEFKRIVNLLFPNKLEKIEVLDIGAGNGMLTELIMREFPNAHISMLDFSKEMLASAQAIFEKENFSVRNIKFIVKNFITDDFPKEKYDLIISSYALHHIRKEASLKNVYLKIANQLKPTGVFLCLDYYLEMTEETRKNQVKTAFERWTKNFNSKKIAKEWAQIIQGEDSPATIPLIITSLNKCNSKQLDIIPFMLPKKGVMAFIYGMISRKNDSSKKLKDYINETEKYIGQEETIASYAFDKYI